MVLLDHTHQGKSLFSLSLTIGFWRGTPLKVDIECIQVQSANREDKKVGLSSLEYYESDF